MGRDFQCIYSKIDIHLNLKAWDYLDKITIGLFEKLGISYPVSAEDCKIIARIIDNHIKYQEYIGNSTAYFGITKLETSEIEFMKKVANFFRNAIYGVKEVR